MQEVDENSGTAVTNERLDKPGKKSYRKFVVLLLVALLAIGLGAGGYIFMTKDSSPLGSYANDANFQLYFPEPLPEGYAVQKGSINSDSGVLFYTLEKSGNTIVVSQQQSPPTLPDFNKLKESLEFKDIDTDIGNAVSGMNAEQPTAILLTNTTLITVNGSMDVPSDVIIELIKNMRSL